MGILAQDERMIIASTEGKSRDLKVKLDALNTFEQVGKEWYILSVLLTCPIGYEEVDRRLSYDSVRAYASREYSPQASHFPR